MCQQQRERSVHHAASHTEAGAHECAKRPGRKSEPVLNTCAHIHLLSARICYPRLQY